MLTTINLDDGLILQAQTITGVREKSALLREALKALIERENAKRLAANPVGSARPATDLAQLRRQRHG